MAVSRQRVYSQQCLYVTPERLTRILRLLSTVSLGATRIGEFVVKHAGMKEGH